MTLTAGIGCVVIREGSNPSVLLLKRAFGELEGEWGFVAGTIEDGEQPERAAARELAEETGLVATVSPVSVVEQIELGVVIHVFRALVSGTPRVVLDSENSEYRWATFEEARHLLPFPAQTEALRLASELITRNSR